MTTKKFSYSSHPPSSHHSMGDTKDRGKAPKRNILIRKENKGYGLTLIGDHPVIIQTVDPGSPADLAGVERGDTIVKVID